MPEEPARFHTLFPCRLADAYLSAIPQVTGPQSPAWTRRYHVLTIGGMGLVASGSVTLSRRPLTEDSFLLLVNYEKRLAGKSSSSTNAQITCHNDDLATPIAWTMAVDSHSDPKHTVPVVAYRHTGNCEGHVVTIRSFGTTRRIAIKDPAAVINWALFEALARSPHRPSPPQRFTLLDDFDQPKPGVCLTFVGTERVILGGKQHIREQETRLERGRVFRPEKHWVGGNPTELARYHLTGNGLVPWIFRVDPAGRMLFAAAGTEAYCLEHDGPLTMTAHEGTQP